MDFGFALTRFFWQLAESPWECLPGNIICSALRSDSNRHGPSMNFIHRAIPIGFAVIVFRISIFAYAPLGHQIVGAIADERLANTPTATKVYALLNGLTLEKAALIADEIKGWDKNGVDDPRSFHYSARRAIDRQLRDFWRANQPSQRNLTMPMPSGLGF